VIEDLQLFDRREARVANVVDGDTVDVQLIGDTTGTIHRVRLLGVDAPEMKDPRTGEPAHFAKEATAYVRARATRGPIILRLEANQTRDRYGRLLAVVWLSESESLNEALVRDGMAYVYRTKGTSVLRSLEPLEADAARRRTGLWKEVRRAQMPEWRVRWMDERGLDWPP
jgi:micrococcal nuclease